MSSMALKFSAQADHGHLENYLHAHRKKAGLSQLEVGILLGYADEGAVSRHEQSQTLPPLLSAIGYEIVFNKPIAELFPGIRETVEKSIDEQLLRFEEELQRKHGEGRRLARIAQKLAWLSERRNTNEE
jgi:transcriptional regulator with XRE-family HTH domain